MKTKRLVLFIALFIFIYLGTGILLLKAEIIQRFYFLPGWSIKHGPTDEDSSGISSDGPIVVYEKDSVVQHLVRVENGHVSLIKKRVNKKDTLTCFVDQAGDSFQFQLADSLKVQPATYELPPKMLVISDIEGNFGGFKSILLGAGIMDDNFNWKFGSNHLTLVGDFFDRGLNVTECLWLVYKLENEARKYGGQVHFILGNHELMNLKGQLKYVRDKYMHNADTLKLGYEKWYTQNTELGRWLRTKNTIEKIGSLLFVHAGISKRLSEKYTIDEINDGVRKGIDKVFEQGMQKTDPFIGSESPLWYRGIAKQEEAITDVSATLAGFRADKMIIGHTIISDDISYLYDQKVIAIDLDHKTNIEKGMMKALWIENGQFFSIDSKGDKTLLK